MLVLTQEVSPHLPATFVAGRRQPAPQYLLALCGVWIGRPSLDRGAASIVRIPEVLGEPIADAVSSPLIGDSDAAVSFSRRA